MTEHRYAWWGNDRNGRHVQGEVQAPNRQAVTSQLHTQRIRPTKIQRQYAVPVWMRQGFSTSIPVRRLSAFTRQFATLIHAGIPLLQALDILQRGEAHPVFKTLLAAVHRDIEAGLPLNQALRRHAVFDHLYCNLVAVGEVTGMLDTLLQRLAEHLEKTEALRATVRSALFYPCIVLTVAFTVLVIILIGVVPAFESIFASFGAELPWLTRAVIGLSRWVQDNGIFVVGVGIAATWIAKRTIRNSPSLQLHIHRLWLGLPVAGPLIRQACTARWTRTLSTLFGAGIPLTDALDSVKGGTGNLLFEAATLSVKAQLMRGVSLSQAIDNTAGLFPPLVIQMCAIGEESGALDHMLDKTAAHFEIEVDRTVARLSTLLEPLIMVVLGLLIGGLVMALYLPIFQLGQVV
jgi:type IV pilus assembly protein PilC